MWEDPIVNEVRKVRQAHAAKFNYDLGAIVEDLKKQEMESNRKFIKLAPERYIPESKIYSDKRQHNNQKMNIEHRIH